MINQKKRRSEEKEAGIILRKKIKAEDFQFTVAQQEEIWCKSP